MTYKTRRMALLGVTLAGCLNATAQVRGGLNQPLPAEQPSAMAFAPDTSLTYCTVLVRHGNRATTYLSPIFAYPYPGNGMILMKEVTPAWQQYMREHYPVAAGSNPYCYAGTGAASAASERLLTRQRNIEIEGNRAFRGRADPPVAEIQWTYQGAPALSTPMAPAP